MTRDLLDRFEMFRGVDATVRPLSGGLTNLNWVVAVGQSGADRYVIRESNHDASLLAIDRDNEEFNARAAATTGISPPVFERIADPPLLVVGYVESRTLTATALRSDGPFDRIATSLRALHSGPPFRSRFDMFDIQARYQELVLDRGWRIPEDYLDHRAVFERIRSVLMAEPEPLVPCHNDLLAENLLDDGSQIWLIDFEYSGNNEASFELGNLASESQLTVEQTEILVAHYWGEHRPDKVARARLWGLVAKYSWTLWGMISASINELDFDFWAWSMERYDVFREAIGSPEFEALLTEAAPQTPDSLSP